MLIVMVTGLLCISMLLVASSCNRCLFIVKYYRKSIKKPVCIGIRCEVLRSKKTDKQESRYKFDNVFNLFIYMRLPYRQLLNVAHMMHSSIDSSS